MGNLTFSFNETFSFVLHNLQHYLYQLQLHNQLEKMDLTIYDTSYLLNSAAAYHKAATAIRAIAAPKIYDQNV